MSFLRAQIASLLCLVAVAIAYGPSDLITPAAWEPYASNLAAFGVWYWLIGCAIGCTAVVAFADNAKFLADPRGAKLVGNIARQGKTARFVDAVLDALVVLALIAVGSFWMALLALLVFGAGRAAFKEADKGQALLDSVADARRRREAADAEHRTTTFAPLDGQPAQPAADVAREALDPNRPASSDYGSRYVSGHQPSNKPDRFKVVSFGAGTRDNPRGKAA